MRVVHIPNYTIFVTLYFFSTSSRLHESRFLNSFFFSDSPRIHFFPTILFFNRYISDKKYFRGSSCFTMSRSFLSSLLSTAVLVAADDSQPGYDLFCFCIKTFRLCEFCCCIFRSRVVLPKCDEIDFTNAEETFMHMTDAPKPPHGINKDNYIGGQFALFENRLAGGTTIYYFQRPDRPNDVARVALFKSNLLSSSALQSLPINSFGPNWFPGYHTAEMFCTYKRDDHAESIHHLGYMFYDSVKLVQKHFKDLAPADLYVSSHICLQMFVVFDIFVWHLLCWGF